MSVEQDIKLLLLRAIEFAAINSRACMALVIRNKKPVLSAFFFMAKK